MTKVSFWRRDLFAVCKTGEVVEPVSAGEKLRELWKVLRWLPAVVAGSWLFKVWVHSEVAATAALMHSDRLAALHRTAQFFTWCFGALALAGVGGCAWLVVLALRVLRAGRWPPANARVHRRTPVVAGWCLWLRCAIPLLLAPILALIVSISAVQLIARAWNTYTDARAGIAAPAVGSAHAKPVEHAVRP